MTNFLKSLSTIILAVALLGCQNDSSEETAQQQQPQQQSQQPGQLGQMQQPSAPDVDVSDEEAGKFADAAMEAQKIQMQAQKRMVQIIQDEGLDVKTFQILSRASQTGKKPDSISDDQVQKYKSANESIRQVQNEIQKEIVNAVENAGMEMQRFEKISKAAQQDSALQKQIQQKLREKMGQQGGPGGMQQQPPGN